MQRSGVEGLGSDLRLFLLLLLLLFLFLDRFYDLVVALGTHTVRELLVGVRADELFDALPDFLVDPDLLAVGTDRNQPTHHVLLLEVRVAHQYDADEQHGCRGHTGPEEIERPRRHAKIGGGKIEELVGPDQEKKHEKRCPLPHGDVRIPTSDSNDYSLFPFRRHAQPPLFRFYAQPAPSDRQITIMEKLAESAVAGNTQKKRGICPSG